MREFGAELQIPDPYSGGKSRELPLSVMPVRHNYFHYSFH